MPTLPTTQAQHLHEVLPQEVARCRELLTYYQQAGPEGVHGAAILEQSLKQAEAALALGDLPALMRAYQNLEGHE
ncbi:MAG: hypothetical protein ACRYFX_18795 [Janthinobacterium lividum]